MESDKVSTPPFDIDPYEAEQAVSNGDAVYIKTFLDETSENILRLSRLISEIELGEGVEAGSRFAPSFPEVEEEWTGATSQVRLAIDRRDFKHLSEYLSRLSHVVSKLSALVDPNKEACERYIANIRERKRGRPRKDRTKEMFERSSLELKSRFSFLRTKKKEASIQEVIDEGGPSRATQFRKLRRSKKA